MGKQSSPFKPFALSACLGQAVEGDRSFLEEEGQGFDKLSPNGVL